MNTEPIIGLAPGMHHNVPGDVYHQRIVGLVSKGALDVLDRSPAHYREWIENGGETTPALEFGSAFHCALLEPERFAAEYATAPDFGDCRFKENKAAKAAWLGENSGKIALSSADYAAISGMIDAVRRHPLAGLMIRDGIAESTIVWHDRETGLPCKVRPDYYVRARRMVVDVKSALDASPEEFKRAIVKRRYHVQDALYRDAFASIGEPVEHFIFVAVEKVEPFAIGLYTLDADGVGKGYGRARAGIATMAECVQKNQWPGYAPSIQTIELPPWAA